LKSESCEGPKEKRRLRARAELFLPPSLPRTSLIPRLLLPTTQPPCPLFLVSTCSLPSLSSTCQKLCTSDIPAIDAVFVNNLIKEDYGYNFLADRLPAAEMKRDERTGETFYDIGGVNL